MNREEVKRIAEEEIAQEDFREEVEKIKIALRAKGVRLAQVKKFLRLQKVAWTTLIRGY